MPAMSLATYGVEPRDSGIASAMINTSQQVGGAIGTALLNTIAATATTSYITAHAGGSTPPELVQLQGMVDGYTTAIWWAVGILVVSAAIAFFFVNATPETEEAAFDELEGEGEAAPVMIH
jgi:hypothetical protein